MEASVTTGMTPSQALRSAWRDQRTWSRTADALKRDIFRWRTAVLALVVGGAVLTTAGTVLGAEAGRAVAYVGAAALALAPVIRGAKLTRERFRDWVRARSASETLKAEAYTYLTRTGPYAHADAEDQLRHRCKEVQDKVQDLGTYSAARAPTEAVEPPAAVLTIDDYIRRRVDDQIEGYYEPKARGMAQRLSWFRRAEFALSMLAALLGVVAAQSGTGGVAIWAPVVTTIIAAIAAHVEAGRFEYQAISYLGTAKRLRQLRDSWLDRTSRGPATTDQASTFVRQCEDAISSENQSWMAEFLQVDKPKS